MSPDPEVDVEDEREEGKLYLVSKKEWYELQDHEYRAVISCEELVEVEP